MARTRAIVKRRKAVRNTRKITKTMEMIATAKFKKASDRIQAAAPYADHLASMASRLVQAATGYADPLLRTPTFVKRVVLLVAAGNRGFCGAYNVNVLSRADEILREHQAAGRDAELIVSGKKAIQYFRYLGAPVARSYTQFEDKPAYPKVRELADDLLARFRSEAFDRLHVVYTRFESSARRRVTDEVFLPLAAQPPASGIGSEAGSTVTRDYIYEPAPAEILAELLPHSFRTRLFTVFLHAAASEQVARMVAMKNATENAGDMIKMLTRMYNRARQSQITTEILEIMGAKASMEG